MTDTLTDFNRRQVVLHSDRVREILPEHFLDQYPNFVRFLEVYYQFLDSDAAHGFTQSIADLIKARDIEGTSLAQLNTLLKEIGLNTLNINYFDDPRFAAKFLTDFYRSKGSILSAEAFFRAFYGIEASIEYPKRNIIIVGESPIGPEDLYVIQDGALYQIYSILIKSELPRGVWDQLYKQFVHQAGFYLGSQVIIVAINESPISAESQPIAIADSAGNSTVYIVTSNAVASADEELTLHLEDETPTLRTTVDETIDKYSSLTVGQLQAMYESPRDMMSVAKPRFDLDSATTTDMSNTIETFDHVQYPYEPTTFFEPGIAANNIILDAPVLGNPTVTDIVSDFSPDNIVTGAPTLGTTSATELTVAPLFLNFAADTYELDGTPISFDSAVSYTSSGVDSDFRALTMLTDSDGYIKFTPHNLMAASNDFGNSTVWFDVLNLNIDSGVSDPDGGNNAFTLTETGGGFGYLFGTYPGDNFHWFTNAFYIRRRAGTGRVAMYDPNITDITVAIDSSWQMYYVTDIGRAAGTAAIGIQMEGSGDQIDIYAAHSFRSGIGLTNAGVMPIGMAKNPDRTDTYVPTTTGPVILPRRNHHTFNSVDSSWDRVGLYVESKTPATNLIALSQDFVSSWGSFNAGTRTRTAISPDGKLNGIRLVDDGLTGTGDVRLTYSTTTVETSTVYTYSCFMKADQLNWGYLGTAGYTTPANGNTFFDLSTGTVGTTAPGHLARIQNYGRGWYRCSITFTTDAADTVGTPIIGVATADNNTTVDRDGTSSIYIFGAQFEKNFVASSYVPTTGRTETRRIESVDVLSNVMKYSTSGTTIQMSGTLAYGDADSAADVTFINWERDADDYIRWTLNTSGSKTGEVTFSQSDSGTLDAVTSDSAAYAPGNIVPFNIAARHGSTFINGAVDGTALTEDLTPTGLALLGSANLSIGSNFTGVISVLQAWDSDKGNGGIAAYSS